MGVIMLDTMILDQWIVRIRSERRKIEMRVWNCVDVGFSRLSALPVA